MTVYTFYPCAQDGTSTSFEAFDLDGDDQASLRALRLLSEHPSCAYVAVWDGDRPVLEKRRPKPAGASLDDRAGARRNVPQGVG